MSDTKQTKATKPVAGDLVDELGSIETELAPLKAKISRAETLRKAIRDMYRDKPANQAFTIEGAKYVVTLGEKSNERKIRNLAMALKLLGRKAFLGMCSITIKALEEARPEFVPALVVAEQTGSRSISIEQKGKP